VPASGKTHIRSRFSVNKVVSRRLNIGSRARYFIEQENADAVTRQG
jgi:hypothetical protein